jgi:splicing factor U2AF 35 kDa subunit
LAKFGEIEEMHVCDNIGDHLIGNVYVKFATEEYAETCKDGITGRYYANKLVVPEYSPVTDFGEGRCRQYADNSCKRGGKCNFMHAKMVPRDLKKAIFKEMFSRYP